MKKKERKKERKKDEKDKLNQRKRIIECNRKKAKSAKKNEGI